MRPMCEIINLDTLRYATTRLSMYGHGLSSQKNNVPSIIIEHIDKCAVDIKASAANDTRVAVLKQYKEDLTLFKEVKERLSAAIAEDAAEVKKLQAEIAAFDF